MIRITKVELEKTSAFAFGTPFVWEQSIDIIDTRVRYWKLVCPDLAQIVVAILFQ